MIKKYLRKNFRFIYDIYKFIKLYKDLKFNGWGMTTNTAPPWLGNSKNKTLIFIYPLVEKNGIILFDDYGFDGYQDTRKVIDDFIFRKISIP